MSVASAVGYAYTVSHALADSCRHVGVQLIYAVSGGGVGALYSAVAESSIALYHARDEVSCMYQALEASLASGCPVGVLVTAGEAVCRATSAAPSVRAEGGHVVLFSGHSNAGSVGRPSIQPTDSETMASDFYRRGPFFDFARVLADPEELAWTFARLAVGFQNPAGFAAHVAVPRQLQETLWRPLPAPELRVALPAPSPEAVAYCVRAFRADSLAVLAGFGARSHSAAVRELVALTESRAFTTPRGKGIVPAPCIGLGAQTDYYPNGRPARLLVLGSRLGEASCGWDDALLPTEEIVHVDLNPRCFGAAYAFPTYGIQAEIGLFLDAVLAELRRSKPMHPAQS